MLFARELKKRNDEFQLSKNKIMIGIIIKNFVLNNLIVWMINK
jgi:hypothetical protein